jgi:hypothetical protein
MDLAQLMKVRKLQEAKTHPSRLEKAAKPVRKPGGLLGKIKIKPGFDDADKEIEKLFHGDPDRITE